MPITRLVLATRNQGKIEELSRLLQSRGLEVVGLDAFPDMGEVAEIGASFVENALIKAKAVAEFTGFPALADDSGLVVDALQGAPGIFSARYGEDWEALTDETRDQRNIRKLLHEMRKIPQEQRACHFETAIAVATPGGTTLTATGQWQGSLLLAPLGKNGFGYDPVFWDNERGKSAAQMKREEKNKISHRAKALASLLAQWPSFEIVAAQE